MRGGDDIVTDLNFDYSLPSDHFAVLCRLKLSKPSASKITVTSRKLRSINVEEFEQDVRSSLLFTEPCDDLEGIVYQYNDVLRTLLDKHAPETTRTVIQRPHTPWYSKTIHDAKRVKRRSERAWKKSGLEVHRQIFQKDCKNHRKLLNKAKTDFYRDEIASCDSRQLFRKVANMSRGSSHPTRPAGDDMNEIANSFANFFSSKISNIRNDLDNAPSTDLSVDISDSCDSTFSIFAPATEDEVRKIIMDAPVKLCMLDPIPTSLLKDCIDVLLPVVTTIINHFLLTGEVPSVLKTARITPILKKANADPDDVKNYRPVSNLPFLSKILERVVSSQLQSYLDENELHSKLQSAYRQHHSTETALLRVQNDLLRAVDANKEAILILLDLSAAFDTIDHDLMLARLNDRYGVTGIPLKWFKSYLSERDQSVVIGKTVSESHSLIYGVPQGSVIGPTQFILYSGPVQDILKAHGINGMVYADDTQLYTVFEPSAQAEAIASIESCVTDIRSWATSNKLKINDDKMTSDPVFIRTVIFLVSRSGTL